MPVFALHSVVSDAFCCKPFGKPLCFCCRHCWMFSLLLHVVCLSECRLSRAGSSSTRAVGICHAWHRRECLLPWRWWKNLICACRTLNQAVSRRLVSAPLHSSGKEALKAVPSWVNHLNASLWLKITNMSWKMWQPCQVFQRKSEPSLRLQLLWFYRTLLRPFSTATIVGLRGKTSLR